ncbi:hypothetical protein GX411_05845 [Candidatus Fermentibacteria bacterium]|nr:hypothetical protein [Candidatus Fermentibacteria bacterium]
MRRRCGLFLAEACERLVSGTGLLAYLLIPVMLSVLVWLESATGPGSGARFLTSRAADPLHASVALALWNAAVSTSLVVAVKSAVFFSTTFGAGWFRSTVVIPAGRCRPFWDTFTAQAVVAALVFVLTNAAVIAAMPKADGFPWVPTLLLCLMPVAWAVSYGALAGVIAKPSAAGVLAACVFGASLVPAFAPLDIFAGRIIAWDILVPPVGALAAGSVTEDVRICDILVVGGHAVLAALGAAWLFGRALKRRMGGTED